MKIFFAGIMAAAVMASAAAAAERPAANWSGCYLGASAGGQWTDTNYNNDLTIGGVQTSFDTNPSGVVGGLQIGCDYQLPSNWLIGIQGDFTWTDASDRKTIFPPLSFETAIFKIDWFASLTGRFGYAFGPWLVYGRGGVAWAKTEVHDFGQFFIPTIDVRGDSTDAGWTLGAGLEYAFAQSWSARIEYDYFDFGENTFTLSGTSTGGPTTLRASLKQHFSVVKVGINYRFWSGRI
jgi:outer membrane immunogenic protein